MNKDTETFEIEGTREDIAGLLRRKMPENWIPFDGWVMSNPRLGVWFDVKNMQVVAPLDRVFDPRHDQGFRHQINPHGGSLERAVSEAIHERDRELAYL